MNVVCKATNCVLVGKSSRQNKEKDTMYYSITVCQDQGEAGSFNVSEELFKMVEQNYGKWLYHPMTLYLTYRESKQYGNFLGVSGIEPEVEGKEPHNDKK